MYTHSSKPRATGLVTTTKKRYSTTLPQHAVDHHSRSVTAYRAFLATLRERAGVVVGSKRSRKAEH